MTRHRGRTSTEPRSLKDRFRELELVHHLSMDVVRAADLEEIYERALDAVREATGADRVSLLLFDDAGLMRFRAWRGLSDEYRAAVEGHSPWNQDDSDPRSIDVSDVLGDESLEPLRDVLLKEGIRSLGFIPLIGERLLGKFMLYHDRPHQFTAEEIHVAETIANNVAFAIERKRVEQALRESEDRYRNLLNAGPDAIFVYPVDEEGTPGPFLEVNAAAARRLGLPREELLRKSVLDIETIPRKRLIEKLSKIRQEGQVVYESEQRTRDGRRIPVEVSVTAATLEGRSCVIGFSRDITARRESARKLRELNETLEQRVLERTAVAERRARQLRELAAQLTYAEQRERKRLAQMLHDHLQQLLVVAKMRLASADLDAGGENLQRSLRSVEEILDETMEASRSLASELSPPIIHHAGLPEAFRWLARRMEERHRLRVDLNVRQEVNPTSEDVRVLLFEAVRELLLNVVKHAGTREAELVLDASAREIGVEVRDGGRGFDPAALDANGFKGHGFGLLSIRERLDALGGELVAESAPGRGALFRLVVPMAAESRIRASETPSVAAERAPFGSRPSRSGPIRVVIVDDHKIVREGFVRLLGEQPDIEVVGQGASGREAIELARALRPDVMVMDVSMPDVNGVEATRTVKSRHPEIEVIALSLHEDIDIQSMMTNAGASLFLTKSGPPEALFRAIRGSYSHLDEAAG